MCPVSSPSRVMTASGAAASYPGTSEFGDEDRAHPRALGPVDVVVRPVADEHADRGIGLAEGGHSRAERLRVRLDPVDLAAVHGAVDQLEDLVPDEDLLVGAARPHRVGQHAHLDAAPPQLAQQLGRLRVGERVRVPRLEVAERKSAEAVTPARSKMWSSVQLCCDSSPSCHSSNSAARTALAIAAASCAG